MQMLSKVTVAFAAWTAISSSLAPAQAASKAGSSDVATISPTIVARFKQIEAMRRDHADPEAILRDMYWPDVIIDGAGSPKTYRGLTDAMTDMKLILVSMQGICGTDIRDPVVTSPTVTVVYGGVTCKDGEKEPVRTKAMWVWLKRGSTWRIIREVYLMEPLK